ncbi:MAG: Flavin-dependent oxidoreductase, luciferase family [Ilumatobacteraceae bacterium]|nr:Flavin-dependent oxidoreductase, luciferase family [Ilumatobacteraceae bacterium]
MKIGLFHTVQWPEGTDQTTRYDEALRQAVLVEELGFESVWFTEHHFFRHGIVSDSLLMLANLAARTSTVRLGTAVSVLPLHNPMRLAESAAMVDVLSHGRLDLGIGRGYQKPEFAGFGLDIVDKETMFDEAVDVLVKCWTSDSFTHEGQHWNFVDASPQPRPVQRPHPPLWFATDSTAGMLKCAANRWGLLLPQGRSVATVADQMDRYRAALAEVGAPADTSRVYLARAMYVGPTDDSARADAAGPYRSFQALANRLAGRPDGWQQSQSLGPNAGPFAHDGPADDSVIFGSPETCISILRKIHDLGVERVMLFTNLGELSHDQIMTSLTLFGREVLPVIKEW